MSSSLPPKSKMGYIIIVIQCPEHDKMHMGCIWVWKDGSRGVQ